MRRCYFRLLEGVLLSLPLLFASCGNGDNALEEIIKNGGTGGSSEGSGEGGGSSSTINATAITLSQTMKVIKLGGDALTITATVTPSDATDKTVTWTSDDPAVATVDNGVVTPVGLGITKITAKSCDKEATCEVFVGSEVDLGTKTDNYDTNDYDILSGDIGAHNINILNSHHVALNGMATTKGISCLGDATIYLIDGKTNTLTAPNKSPGIWIGGTGKTFTINAETEGTGILNATGGNLAAGIGTGYAPNATVVGGNITINGGVINATGGSFYGKGGAGIGTGGAEVNPNSASNECGTITINGGTVIATGGEKAAGIGTGTSNILSSTSLTCTNTCGAITIGSGITSVTAIKGNPAYNVIGVGVSVGGGTEKCGVIKFGTAEVFDGTVATGTWSPNDPMLAGTYGGLNLVISKTNVDDDTWTLTPVAP